MSKFYLVFVSTLIFSSTLFSQLNSGQVTYRVVDIKDVNIAPQDFDLVISIDSSKTVSSKSNKKHKSPQLALDEAYFNAIVDNEIDVLINPIHSIKKTGKFLFFFGGNCEASITGYAGYYKLATEKNTKGVMTSIKPDGSVDLAKLNCHNDNIDCLIDQLNEFSKNYKQEVIEEKEFKTIYECKNCKEGQEPLRVLIVRTKKKSILDSYLKLRN